MVLTGCDLLGWSGDTCSVTTVYKDGELTVSPSETIVSKGGVAKLTYSTFTGYIIKDIKVNGTSIEVPNGNVLYLKDINTDQVIEFITEPVIEFYTVFASANEGGTVRPSGEVTVEKGQSQIFDFVSDNSHWVDSVYIDEIGKKAPEVTTVAFYNFYAEDTLHHSFRVVFRPRKTFTITTSVDSLGTITPLGVTSVTEGGSLTINAIPDKLCSLTGLYIDGTKVPGTSYTFTGVKENHTVLATFKKEPEWYLCKGKWRNTLTMIGEVRYEPLDEVLNFFSSGSYQRYLDGNYRWTMKWEKKEALIKINYGGWDSTVDTVDTSIMIFHYTGYTGTTIAQIYENIGD
jgi:hypothetical protein